MSDPLSVAGTITGLAGLAIQLSHVSYQYVASVKGSSKAWSSYIQELSALTSVLLRLQTAGEVQERGSVLTTREPSVSKDAVNECIRELHQLKIKLDDKLARRGVMGKLDALVWPFSELDTQKKVNMLHRFHDLFVSVLLADNFTVSVASYRELREQRQEKEFKQVLDWFQPHSGPQKAGPIGEQRCPNTGSSFLEHEEYLNWRDSSDNCLWALGQPGVGKTVLSAAVLDDLATWAPKGAIIAYHFFRADDSEDSLQDFLRHLVFQGLSQRSEIIPEALEVRRLHTMSNIDPLPKDLVPVLVAICEASPAMYVVLDGLDECQYLAKLARHFSTLRLSGMKILITSRDLPDVRKHLEWCHQLEVRPERDDIFRYVNWRLREDAEVEYDLLGDKLKEELASKLFDHADGSFLLVRLLLDHIGSLTTIKKIRKFLEALPSDYQEAYQRTFDRIMKHNAGRRDLALKVLKWVSNTKRPLTMRELQHAIAAEDSEGDIGDEDLESPKAILSSCLGLVRLSRTDDRVELIHSSARSFVQKNRAGVFPDADISISRACLMYLSNLEMSSGPSTSLEDFTRRFRLLPFLDYASRFYGYHVRSVEQHCVPELRQFLEDERLREASWQVLHFTFSPHHALGRDIFAGLPSHTSILHVASYWGFSRFLATFFENSDPSSTLIKADIDAHDSHGWTPLHWAASMGQVDVAKLLLASGAAVDSLDSAQWTPLFWAAIKGHHDVASLLLSRGANVHQVDSDGMAPLHWSVSAGQDAVTQLLLGIIEKAHVWKPSGGNAIVGSLENREGLSISKAKQMTAPFTRSKSIVQISAESLDTKSFSDFMRSTERRVERESFYFYKRYDDPPAIEPLFRKLWRVRTKGDYFFWRQTREKDPIVAFRTRLLERAIECERISVVKALLDLDEDLRQDINEGVVSSNQDSYLHKACTRRNPEIATALIAKGADINRPNRQGMTPLHFACKEGSSDIVNAILRHESVNIDAKDKEGQTSLMTLLHSGGWRTQHHPEENLAICRALIERGASVRRLDKNGNTAANIAIRVWDPAVIQLLVDAGIRFSKRAKDGMTPLHLIASAPFEVLAAKAYLSRGSSEEKYQIPSAAIEKTTDLVTSLTDTDDMSLTCYVKYQGIKYNYGPYHNSISNEETALSLAMASENWVVARRLHDLGVRFKTSRPLYPLLIETTRAGIPELVQLLVENGADVNQPQSKAYGKTCDEGLLCLTVRLAKGRNSNTYTSDFWSQANPTKGVKLTDGKLANGKPTLEPMPPRAPSYLAPNYLATGNYFSVMRVLINAGIDVTRADGYGIDALEYAVTGAVASDILQVLLNAGSNPYTPTSNGFDYFQLAVLHGSPSNLSCLLEYNKTHAAPASHWLHQLHSTTGSDGKDDLVQKIVTALSQAGAIDARDNDGHTLLFNAAFAGNQAVAQELITCGADVNDTDPLGWTPFLAAVSQNDVEMVRILLKAGADISGMLRGSSPWKSYLVPEQCSGLWPNPNLKFAYKAIHLSLLKPYQALGEQKPPSPEVVRLLLDSGADPNEAGTQTVYDNTSTVTPIQLLFKHLIYPERRHIEERIFGKLLEVAEMLVQSGAVVGDVALKLGVEQVAQFEGHEELWETLQKGMKGN